MAIDASIALGIKPIQVENPLNNMVKFSNIQNDMANMALHRQKYAQDERLQQEDRDFKSTLAGIPDLNSPEGKAASKRAHYIHGRGKDWEAMQVSEAGVDKSHVDAEKEKLGIGQSTLRDLSRNHSNENIIANWQDAMMNPIWNAADRDRITKKKDMLLAMHPTERGPFLASQGASAADLKQHIGTVNTGGSTVTTSTDPYSGKTIQVGEVAHTLTPEQELNAVPGQAKLVAEYNQTAAAIQGLLAKANDPANAGQATQLLADAKDLSNSNELRGEAIKGMQGQAAQGKHAASGDMQLVNELSMLEANGQGKSPRATHVRALLAKQEHIAQADESVVVRTTTDNDGTVHMYNRFGAELRSQKNAGKTAPDSLAGPEKRMPAHILETVAKNNAAVANIDNSIKQVQANPSSFGVQNYLPDAITQRTDPKGVTARATVANIGSLKIHDRSGAAVTVGETPRLRPFIPATNDDDVTVVKKLKELRREMLVMDQEYKKTLSEQGYRTSAPAGAAPAATRTGATVSNWN